MKKITYQTDKQLEGIRWMARVIEFGVSLSFTVAINELYRGHLALREDKSLFRMELKKLANDAVRLADIKKGSVMAVMKDYVFYDVYSDLAIDLSEDIVTMLRFNIKQELDRKNHPKSMTVADIETARVMLILAHQQYESVIQEASEKFNFSKSILNSWSEFDLGVVLNTWDKVCDRVYNIYHGETIDLNTPNISSVTEEIGHAFGDGEYIEKCLCAAKNARPNFFNDFVCVER